MRRKVKHKIKKMVSIKFEKIQDFQIGVIEKGQQVLKLTVSLEVDKVIDFYITEHRLRVN